MTDRISTITNLIDAALSGNHTQRSNETSYGDDFGDGVCWRCAEPAANDSTSGLCDGCRAFLLEDSDLDPADTVELDGWEMLNAELPVGPGWDGEPRRRGPAPGTVEAAFPGYAPITLPPDRWEEGLNGWDPGPVRFTHAGGEYGSLVVGYWLCRGEDTMWYTILHEPTMLVGGRHVDVNVTEPLFGNPPDTETVVRLMVDRRIESAQTVSDG